MNAMNIIGQPTAFPEISGPYLGQNLPDKIPELFAPGIISTGFMERDFTITPDGKEIYYGLATGKLVTIMFTQLKDEKWTEPEIAPFAKDPDFLYFEPCLSSDGNSLFFLSTKPTRGKEPKPRWTYQNIWAADRNADGTWGEPYEPDTLINSHQLQFYPSITKDGTLYFCRTDIETRKSSVFRSRYKNGKYSEPEFLDAPFNMEGSDRYNAYISPDESFLITCTHNEKYEANPGVANYFIFFRDINDKWSDGIAFGPEINIKGSSAISASISPDGKYLFFAAQKTDPKFQDIEKIASLNKLVEFANSPQNGNYDIYWVSAKIIEDLRKTIK